MYISKEALRPFLLLRLKIFFHTTLTPDQDETLITVFVKTSLCLYFLKFNTEQSSTQSNNSGCILMTKLHDI